VDWDNLGNDALSHLQNYLRIDTTNPPGNEAPAAEFLGGILEAEGIDFKLYESDTGRTSLLARLEGDGEGKPLILLNHIDVVPADPDGWEVHPFSGEIRDGYVWGRGALDMKGMGIMELMAFIAARREGLELRRDLVFLAVADEEAGGYKGIKYLLDEHPEELEAELVINEGGYATSDIVAGSPFFMISVAEKYAMWLKITRKGPGGHGSMPTGQGALECLVLALGRLLSSPRPMVINPIMRAYFTELAKHWEILNRYREDGDVETLRGIITENNLMAVPALGSMLRDTVSLNMLNAGVKENVIPDEATAHLDCRLLPETEPEEFVASVRESMRDQEIDIDIVLHGERSPATPVNSDYYRALEKTIAAHYPEAAISPFLLSGMSDSRFFRALGILCLGIIPASLGMADLSSIHGVNEKIAVADVKKGTEFLYDLITTLCT
jgi:acetylornithine deacetylase/succinyl-diaminopimelate desuccinylase-like protein